MATIEEIRKALSDLASSLKPAEPVRRYVRADDKHYDQYKCSTCGNLRLYFGQKYCGECGKAVKWDDQL